MTQDTWQGVPDVKTDDVGFTLAVLDSLLSQFRIDSKKVFATGKSQGGGFVGVLACDSGASQKIAAFASVSGAFYTKVSEDDCDPANVKITCNPGRLPVPFIEFHGGKDETIRYYGGPRKGKCLPTIPHYLREWAKRNDLGTQNKTATFTRDTIIYQFSKDLVLGYLDSSIGHDWPATVKNSDAVANNDKPATYNATTIILDYFGQHTLP
jgi:poly(3-hydroxybutyrate) depolymerase